MNIREHMKQARKRAIVVFAEPADDRCVDLMLAIQQNRRARKQNIERSNWRRLIKHLLALKPPAKYIGGGIWRDDETDWEWE
jgi:hypothetical protein